MIRYDVTVYVSRPVVFPSRISCIKYSFIVLVYREREAVFAFTVFMFAVTALAVGMELFSCNHHE
jgi:hypothetical protein